MTASTGLDSESSVQGPVSPPAASVTLDTVLSFSEPQFSEIDGTGKALTSGEHSEDLRSHLHCFLELP